MKTNPCILVGNQRIETIDEGHSVLKGIVGANLLGRVNGEVGSHWKLLEAIFTEVTGISH